jgi:hypothetical protein
MTPDLYLLLIERFPSTFGSLLESVRTPELCLKAVSLAGTNLRYVTNKTQELCSIAMRQSSNAFQYIPVEFRDEEVYYLAVKHSTVSLNDIPVNRRSKRMCLSSVKNNTSSIQYVPERRKTAEFYTEVFEHNKNIFKYMPNEMKTEEVCMKALKANYGFIEFIPKEQQTDNICLSILSDPYNHNLIKLITSDSPVVQKKMKRLDEREKKMKKMFRGGFYMHSKHDPWGMPPFDMFMEPVLEYVYDCEDKIEDLSDMVESLKKEMDELKKLIPRPREAHEG